MSLANTFYINRTQLAKELEYQLQHFATGQNLTISQINFLTLEKFQFIKVRK